MKEENINSLTDGLSDLQ